MLLISGFPIPRGEGETGKNKYWMRKPLNNVGNVATQNLLGYAHSDFRSSPFGLRCGFGYNLYHFEMNL